MSTDLDPRDADLRSRFTAAAESVTVVAGSTDDVRSRGRRRTRNQRLVAAGGVVGAVALAVVGLGSLTPTVAPSIEPVGGDASLEPSAPEGVETAPPSPSSSETGTSAGDHPPADLSGPDHPWAYTRFSETELSLRSGTTTATYGGSQLYTRVIATTDGRVVYQSKAPGSEALGGGGLSILDDGDLYEVGPIGRYTRLLAATEERAWFTYRVGGEGEEDREELAWIALEGGAGREATVVGTSSGVESATDDLVFLGGDAGPIAFLSCHLQCGLYRADSIDAWMSGRHDGDPLLSGWLYGLGASVDGGALATVVGPDPNLPGDDATLVVVEVTGEPLAEIRLPSGIDWGAGRVEFSPDNRHISVTDLDGGWLLTDWWEDDPRISRLADAGLTWHGHTGPPVPGSDDPRRYTEG